MITIIPECLEDANGMHDFRGILGGRICNKCELIVR